MAGALGGNNPLQALGAQQLLREHDQSFAEGALFGVDLVAQLVRVGRPDVAERLLVDPAWRGRFQPIVRDWLDGTADRQSGVETLAAQLVARFEGR